MIYLNIFFAFNWLLIIPINAAVYYTPFVDICDFATARQVSKPKSDLFKHYQVHAGFFTVNKEFDINLFSVYIKTHAEKAPLVVWLQGQPDAPSLYAIFGQHGPFSLGFNDTFKERIYSWTALYNVLYLDNMIYNGYSYSSKTSDIVIYLSQIDTFLHEALLQFYQIFPESASKDLYLAGEYYAGKFLLQLGHRIHRINPLSHVKMNLKGLFIGSGLADPVHMMDYSSLFYQIGIIDYETMKGLNNLEEAIVKGIRSKRYDAARQQYESIWFKLSQFGFPTPFDFTKVGFGFDQQVVNFLQSPIFREAFDLDDRKYHYFNNTTVKIFRHREMAEINISILVEEFIFESAIHLLPALLNHYKVLFYGAQFDLRVPYVHISTFLQHLEWKGATNYYDMIHIPRRQWIVDTELAGFQKTVGNLTEVMVRNAGHLINVSQPKWAFRLLASFISNEFQSPTRHVETRPPNLQQNYI